MNAKTQAAVEKHGRELLEIFPDATERDPVKLCKKLRKLEREGNALGLRLCNGPQFDIAGEPGAIEAGILGRLDALLNYIKAGVPVFVNLDPRGYALKIESEWIRDNAPRFHRDWGGFGIIAPDLTVR